MGKKTKREKSLTRTQQNQQQSLEAKPKADQTTNVNNSDQGENSALHDAIIDKKAIRDWYKQIEAVKTLLKQGASVNTSDTESNTLYIAIRHYYFCLERDLTIVKLLIEQGASLQKTVGTKLLNDILAKEDDYLLPLYRTRKDKFTSLINLLLENGAVVDNSNTLNNTLININFGGRDTCEDILSILVDLLKHGMLYPSNTKLAQEIIEGKKLSTNGTFFEYLFCKGIAWLDNHTFERLLKTIMQNTDITFPNTPFGWDGCKTHHTIAQFYLQLKQTELVCMTLMQAVRLNEELKHLSIPNEIIKEIFNHVYLNAERRALGLFVTYTGPSPSYQPNLTSVKEKFLISIFNKNNYIMQQRNVLKANANISDDNTGKVCPKV